MLVLPLSAGRERTAAWFEARDNRLSLSPPSVAQKKKKPSLWICARVGLAGGLMGRLLDPSWDEEELGRSHGMCLDCDPNTLTSLIKYKMFVPLVLW